MKIYQRYKNLQRQNVPNIKAYQRYSNHYQHPIQDNELSFNTIQTPGWTSLVNTTQSKQNNNHFCNRLGSKNNPNPHKQILNRLNSLPKLDKNKNFFPKIHVSPSLTKNKNVFIYQSAKTDNKNNYQKDQKRLSNTSNNVKPNIFYSVRKNNQSNGNTTPRNRIESARSHKNSNLKDKIKGRLSTQSYKNKDRLLGSQIKMEEFPNSNFNKSFKPTLGKNFQSKIHSYQPIKQQKNLYLNRYLNKLNQRRAQSCSTTKVFKNNNGNYNINNGNCNMNNGYLNQNNENLNKNNENLNKNRQSLIKNKQNIAPTNIQRFNTITIYDHLYKNSIKLQSKRKMLKMVDQSYQKACVLTFTPRINQKSNVLAQIKFQKQNNVEFTNPSLDNHKNCTQKTFNKIEKTSLKNKQLSRGILKIQQKVAQRQKDKMAQKLQNLTLIKLFNILSNNSLLINQKNLQQNIEKLSLSLIQLLEPILTKVYKKKTFSYKQFIELFSISTQNCLKEIASKRNIIIAQTEKYIKTKEINAKTKNFNYFPGNQEKN